MKKSIKLLLTCMFAILYVGAYSQSDMRLLIGKVTSEAGEPLPGVSIVIKGTETGTITDFDGNYKISARLASSSVLVFSYVGFESQSIAVGNKKEINVSMIEDSKSLEEVVVVGYGTMKKKDMTGATTSIKTADIASGKSSNALQVLQGRVPGLDVVQSNGEAGSSVKLVMRGTRSISAGNSPLVIVDGVEYGSALDLNSSDIESIDILKDAASTAIYGTRGSNGVIIVTTKKGKSGKTHVNYNAYVTTNQAAYLPHIMNGAEYMDKQFLVKIADGDLKKWNNQGISYNSTTNTVAWNQTTYPTPNSVWGTTTLDELVAAAGVADKYALTTGDPEGLELARAGVSLDYLDMIMKKSMSHNHEISVYGGDAKTSFNISLGYMNDNGLLKNDNMNRYNIKVGVDHLISKSLKVGGNILMTKKDYNKRNSSVFNQALKAGPIGKLYEDDGVTYRAIPDLVFAYNQNSPMMDEVDGAFVHQIMNNRIFTTLYANWEIIKDLTFRTSLGLDMSTVKDGLYAGANSIQQQTVLKPSSSLQYSDNFAYTFDNTLNYTKKIGVHSLQALLGSSTTYSRYQSLKVTQQNQLSPSTLFYDQNMLTGNSTASAWEPLNMVSVFGRVNYSLLDRYLLQATLRYDIASVLSEGYKGQTYPSLSAGWRISEESFMKNQNIFSNLKLRYSWGSAGNVNSVPPYATLASLSTNMNYFSIGNTTYQQYAPSTVANNSLTWETTQTHDIGLDFEILNKRVSGSVDVYKSNSNNLIFKIPLPTNQGGYTEAWKNIASSQNRGIEVLLTTYNVKSKNFNWSTDWGFSMNENKITSLYSNVTQLQHDGDRVWQVGSQVNSYLIYQVEGLYQVDDMQKELDYVQATQAAGGTIDKLQIPMLVNKFYPGDIKIKDANGDGIYNLADQIAVGADPKYIFNFNNNLDLTTDFGSFGLSVLTIGRINQNMSYDFYGTVKTAGDKTNGSYVQTWTPEHTDAIFPRYYTTGTNNTPQFMNALSIVKGSFVKIKDITLTYSFPKTIVSNLKIDNLKLYATAKNMFTFSTIENYDPESGGTQNFPMSKQIIFGLNLGF